MMGPSHAVAGGVAWIAVAPLFGVHGWPLVAGVAVAAVSAHGRLSPDCDRYPLLAKFIPGGHRGLTHWWPWPVLAVFLAGPPPFTLSWPVLAVAVAWASHDVTDAVFGKVPIWPKITRHGVRWRCWGLGFRTGGWVERWIAVPGFVLFAAWLLITGSA
jgi:hypothetical protein